jgi:hypothetical protein
VGTLPGDSISQALGIVDPVTNRQVASIRVRGFRRPFPPFVVRSGPL